MTDILARMKQLGGTTAEWAANDLVIGLGELAVEFLAPGSIKAKIGDGVKKFSQLAYVIEPFVRRAGDTMTGALNGPAAYFSTLLEVGTNGTEGYVHLNEGGPANAGYMAFHKADGTRLGYLGFYNDRVGYTAEGAAFHEFFGPVKVPTPPAGAVSTEAVTAEWVRALGTLPQAVIGNNAAQVNLGPTGTYTNICNTGAIGAAGQKWRIEAGANIGNSPSGYDFCSISIHNGTAIVGSEITVGTINGINVFAATCAIVTLTAATTFTLRAKDNSSGGGYALPGCWVTAQRVG